MAKCLLLQMTIGVWEAEMLKKALEQYPPKSAKEKNSQADLLRLIGNQIDKEKNQ